MSFHPHEDLLVQFTLAGTPPWVATHVAECEACAREAAELRELITDAAEVPPVPEHRLSSFRAAAASIAQQPFLDEASVRALLHSSPGDAPLTYPQVRALLTWLEGRLRVDPLSIVHQTITLADHIQKLPGWSLPPAAIDALTGDLWKLRSHAFRLLGRYPEALEALNLAASFYMSLPDSEHALAVIDCSRAVILSDLDQWGEAQPLLAAAIGVYERYGDERRHHSALLQLGNIALARCDFRTAKSVYEDLFSRTSDLETRAALQLNLAQAALQLGQLAEAKMHAEEAAAFFRERGLRTDVLRASWVLARIELTGGKLKDAAERLLVLRSEFRDAGLLEEAGLATIDLVEIRLVANAPDAATLVDEAIWYFREARLEHRSREALAYLSEVAHLRTARPSDARYVRAFLEENSRRRTTQMAFSPPA